MGRGHGPVDDSRPSSKVAIRLRYNIGVIFAGWSDPGQWPVDFVNWEVEARTIQCGCGTYTTVPGRKADPLKAIRRIGSESVSLFAGWSRPWPVAVGTSTVRLWDVSTGQAETHPPRPYVFESTSVSPFRRMVRPWPVAVGTRRCGCGTCPPGRTKAHPPRPYVFGLLRSPFRRMVQTPGQWQWGRDGAVVGRVHRAGKGTPSKAIRMGSNRCRFRRMGAPWPVAVGTSTILLWDMSHFRSPPIPQSRPSTAMARMGFKSDFLLFAAKFGLSQGDGRV